MWLVLILIGSSSVFHCLLLPLPHLSVSAVPLFECESCLCV